jgi:hypothetical protein
MMKRVSKEGGLIMIIRPAKEGDAQSIAKVHVDSWKTTYKDLIGCLLIIQAVAFINPSNQLK